MTDYSIVDRYIRLKKKIEMELRCVPCLGQRINYKNKMFGDLSTLNIKKLFLKNIQLMSNCQKNQLVKAGCHVPKKE